LEVEDGELFTYMASVVGVNIPLQEGKLIRKAVGGELKDDACDE
jgi:hypothetical protein